MAGIAALLVALLIEGCVSEHSKIAASTTSAGAISKLSTPANDALVADHKIRSSPQPNLTAKSPLTPPASKENAAAPAIHSATDGMIYSVKSGDTLSRIARAHGTTVKALKSANGLVSDRILVGAKLKIPEA